MYSGCGASKSGIMVAVRSEGFKLCGTHESCYLVLPKSTRGPKDTYLGTYEAFIRCVSVIVGAFTFLAALRSSGLRLSSVVDSEHCNHS